MVALRALTPTVPPGPGPVDLLNAARDPFRVHPPHSMAMFVSWSGRTLIGHLAVICGLWVNPRHRRGPRDQTTAVPYTNSACSNAS